MKLRVTTFDRDADFELMQSTHIRPGISVDIGSGITLTHEGTLMFKADGFPSVLQLAAELGVGVTAQVAANAIWAYLAKRLKTRPVKLTIERMDVEFDEGDVKRLIVETLTKEPVDD